MFSKMLYHDLNEEYKNRIDSYYEQCLFLRATNVQLYPTLLEWLGGQFTPDGAKIREIYEKAQNSNFTRSGISEVERCTREIQSVECSLTMAQDHTMEMVKNYQKKLGAKAAWTVCTETGEIASVVLVQNTKSSQFAHAAESLARRKNFTPQVMYADTWPHLTKFWALLFGSMLTGRLGLFHFIQRIIKTLRDSHSDYRKSILDLRMAIYSYDEHDYHRLVHHLKSGTLCNKGTKYTEDEINDMKISGMFKDRYDKWLRKKIHNYDKVRDNIEAWFVQYKFSNSQGKEPGRGRKDPINGKLLFTPDTKKAITEAYESCKYIGDVLPCDQMYTPMAPSPHSTHGLNTFICHRVESRLEGFHEPLGNFANSNMSANLADILNLIGTTRYNCNVRQKLSVINLSADERKRIPSHCLLVPEHYNHCELLIVNNNARLLGLEPAFRNVRILPPDNGERFFSAYLLEQTARNLNITPHFNNDRCQCPSCGGNAEQLFHEQIAPTIYHEDIDGGNTDDFAISPPKKKKARMKKEIRCNVEEIKTTVIEPSSLVTSVPMTRPNFWHPPMYQQNIPPFMYRQPHPSSYFNMWQPWGPPPHPQYPPNPQSNFAASEQGTKKRKKSCKQSFAV
jgi:hypothetical protein